MKSRDNSRSNRFLKRYMLENVIGAIRTARRIFKSDDVCTSIKYKAATDVRAMVRQARDAGVISFECCNALQRALDY